MGRNFFTSIAWLLLRGFVCSANASIGLTLSAPVDYQVIQRSSRGEGELVITGKLDGEDGPGFTLAYRLVAAGEGDTWRHLEPPVISGHFTASVTVPAGGWRRLEVQAVRDGKIIGEASVEHVGIGEVFVVAGQSNSANHGEERQRTATGQVASFDAGHWRVAHDPQPGASGDGGSFLPPFGDALAARWGVPIGFVACGVGATSVREWLPRGSRFPQPPTLEGNVQPVSDGGWESRGVIFDVFKDRLTRLGPRGFRAVLWHQGESDANQPDPKRSLPEALYRKYLEALINESSRALGWEVPWFVAQASYHVPGDEASQEIRAAQASLWRDGVALPGPDTDALTGVLREEAGQGVHFSGPGLREHAARWVEKVAPWVEARLTPWPDRLIGYSELQTNLPGGRHANARTLRAFVVQADGAGRREVAPELAMEPDTSTQFAGWSPDGKLALLHQAWKNDDTARWEEENRAFRFTPDGCRLDTYLFDVERGGLENITAIDRVSFYNSGVFFWPGDASKLGFTALIEGASHPFRMDRDGRNKTDLTSNSKAFSYGFSSSPDGRRIAFHQDYQVVIADSDGSNARRVETGNPFNFAPAWSPDGQWLLFLSGEHYDCHPTIVRADGSGLRRLAHRNGYRGVVEFLDVPDFHGGSSDTPVWTSDSQRVLFTAKHEDAVELRAVDMHGIVKTLTRAGAGTEAYHPTPSPDGNWLVFGAKRHGVRQLVVMRLADHAEKQITEVPSGRAAMWPHWRPHQGDR